jgi:hypothetical protein
VKRTDAGPGTPPAKPPSPWFYDYGTNEIVRASDGMRWPVEDVPELRRSVAEWPSNPVVDVAEVDRWVVAQPGRKC